MSTNIDKINTIFGDSLMKSIVNLIIYLRVLLIAIKQNKSHKDFNNDFQTIVETCVNNKLNNNIFIYVLIYLLMSIIIILVQKCILFNL